MFRKILATTFLLILTLTVCSFPLMAEQARADSVSDIVGGIGGGLAGAGAGGALGSGVGGLIGRAAGDQRLGSLIGAGVGAIAGAVAGVYAGVHGNTTGLGGLGLGQFSNYGIHVPQGTVLQANNPQLSPLIVQIINFFLGFVGLIAFLMFVYGGFRYLASAGDAEATKKGKQTIMYAVIGVVVIAISYAATSTLIAGIGPQVTDGAILSNTVNNFPGTSGLNLGFAVGVRF